MQKLSSLASWLIISALAAPFPTLVYAADDMATRRLIEQAQYWQKKGRDDLASGIWKKLLQADPNNPEALVELGSIEARAGRVQDAEALAARARALPSPPERLAELEVLLKVGRSRPEELATARKEAQAGASDEAVTRYKTILGDTKPEGPLGLEYYQTLGGTSGGWEEARRGLESLAQKHPGDERYLLALAKHLTYREATRREGIRQLAALATHGQSAEETQKAWRQALVWLGKQRPSDQAFYDTYLKRFPNDQILRERLSQADKTPVTYRPTPEQLARQAGFAQLNKGDLNAAEKRFLALLERNSRDTEALAGLGIVRLRQQDFAEAVRLLDRAVATGGKAGRWDSARRSARYWLVLQPAIAAQESNTPLDSHEQAIQNAIHLDPKEPTAQVLLADLHSGQRNWQSAEPIYRQVLRTHPDHSGAFLGLISLLVETGRGGEAVAMTESLDSQTIDKAGSLNQAKAASLVKIAEAEERAGHGDVALRNLEDALLLDANSPWVRLALIRQYQRLGEAGAVNSLIDDLVLTYPDLPEAQQVRATVYADQGQWWDALKALEQIPATRRTPEMAREQKRFWINAQVERARQFYAQGNSADGQSILTHTERAAGEDTGLVAVVATAWANVGQNGRALKLMRQIGAKGNKGSVGDKLQYAALLLNVRQDVELLPLLRDLASSGQLSSSEQGNLNNLIIAYTLRQTDALREAGRLAEAYDLISPVLAQSDDPRLQMALARLYNTGRDPVNALLIAEKVISREPGDLEYRLFAAGVALGAKAYDKATLHAEAALDIAPDHPRALATAGRVEKARGNLARAMEYFQYAQALEGDKRAFSGVPGNLALRLVDKQAPLEPSSAATSLGRSVVSSIPNGSLRITPQNSGRRLDDSTERLPAGRSGGGNILPIPTGRVTPAETRFSPTTPVITPPEMPVPLSQGGMPSSRQEDLYLRPASFDLPNSAGSGWLATTTAETPRKSSSESSYLLADNAPARRYTTTSAAKPADKTMDEEIREISLQFSTTLEGGVGFHSRSGEVGTSRLRAIETPFEARIPNYQGTLVLRMTPVLLDAGSIDLSRSGTATRFGSAALGSFLVPGTFTKTPQDAAGVALSAALQSKNLNLDVGTTPLGFPIQNVVGGVTLLGSSEDMSLKGSLTRRAVTDSLLSYAGTQDPLTGKNWGGVVKTGVRFDGTVGDDDGGVYATAGAYRLTGESVKSNNSFEGGFGGYWRAYQSTDTRLTMGVNVTAMAYEYNLGQFTLGHGGYFSPQRYLAFGVPFDLASRSGRLAYQLGGDVGLRQMKQDSSSYFPADPALQSQWESIVATPAGSAYTSRYAADDNAGIGYKFYGAVEYRVSSRLAVGGRLAFDNSRNYEQQSGLIYLRHAFDGLPQQISFPPRSLRLLTEGDAP